MQERQDDLAHFDPEPLSLLGHLRYTYVYESPETAIVINFWLVITDFRWFFCDMASLLPSKIHQGVGKIPFVPYSHDSVT